MKNAASWVALALSCVAIVISVVSLTRSASTAHGHCGLLSPDTTASYTSYTCVGGGVPDVPECAPLTNSDGVIYWQCRKTG